MECNGKERSRSYFHFKKRWAVPVLDEATMKVGGERRRTRMTYEEIRGHISRQLPLKESLRSLARRVWNNLVADNLPWGREVSLCTVETLRRVEYVRSTYCWLRYGVVCSFLGTSLTVYAPHEPALGGKETPKERLITNTKSADRVLSLYFEDPYVLGPGCGPRLLSTAR